MSPENTDDDARSEKADDGASVPLHEVFLHILLHAVPILVIIAIGIIDYVTGPLVPFALFYILPIFLAVKIDSERFWYGLLATAFASGTWLMLLIIGKVYSDTLILVLNAGTKVAFFFFIALLMRAGERQRLSLRKKNEELTVTQHKLEAAMNILKHDHERLDEFTRMVAHDLKGPIVSIQSFLKLLGKRSHDALDDTMKDLYSHTTDVVRRMTEMIDGLLRFARSSRVNLSDVSSDPADVLSQVLKNLAASIEANSASVHYQRLPVIRVDRLHLESIFQNLIQNAIKYRREEPPRITILCEQSEGCWMFAVSDNGKGIPPKDIERVFRMFERLEAGGEGSGIGLALCKRIVEQYGGRIWVESEIDRGSTFYFTLPT